jgi:dual specificity tyrosine-phosphorylation-regulated kinase 2/3/4
MHTGLSLSSVQSQQERPPPLPLKPQNVLKHYYDSLTESERVEILEYELIYFLGCEPASKPGQKQEDKQTEAEVVNQSSEGESNQQSNHKPKGPTKYIYNNNYDDENGDYHVVTGDHIGFRYEIKEFLGKGSFGTALRCFDHKEQKEVAVKIVKNKKKYYYQASVELRIL